MNEFQSKLLEENIYIPLEKNNLIQVYYNIGFYIGLLDTFYNQIVYINNTYYNVIDHYLCPNFSIVSFLQLQEFVKGKDINELKIDIEFNTYYLGTSYDCLN